MFLLDEIKAAAVVELDPCGSSLEVRDHPDR
jgi:hypothetical protein